MNPVDAGEVFRVVNRDLSDWRAIYLKAFLFLCTGSLAVFLLLFKDPTVQNAALIGIAIWAFARAYYFAFYVIEHYVDGQYRFAGLWSFFAYLLKKR